MWIDLLFQDKRTSTDLFRSSYALAVRCNIECILDLFVLNPLCNDQESCPGKLIEIHGKAGLFMEGQIHPELEGVEIVIGEKGAPSPLITVFTDDKGAYR